MKRYWVFAYETYERCGGMNDFYDAYDTELEAAEMGIKLRSKNSHKHWHVVDSTTGEIVRERGSL